MTMQNWLGLSNEHLVQVDDSHFLHKEALKPFLALQASAQSAGIDLQLFSSYRDFEKQLSIWNRKWNGQLAILDANNNPLDTNILTDTEKMHAIMLWSALPGASRHHWGTDIDVYDKAAVALWGERFELISDEYSGNGPCSVLSQWLDEHAASFGFYRPYAEYTGGIGAEPWHISHRETANSIATQFDKSLLLALINKSDLAGKETIIRCFDEIYKRYILNQGSKNR